MTRDRTPTDRMAEVTDAADGTPPEGRRRRPPVGDVLRGAAVLMAVLVLSGWEQAAAPRTETFWQKILRITGISATPSTLRAPGDEATEGEIWLATVEDGAVPTRVTDGRDYRSPIFEDGDDSVLALRRDDLVRIPLRTRTPEKLRAMPNVLKLVGVEMDRPGTVLLLGLDGAGNATARLLSLAAGTLADLPHNPQSPEDRRLMAHLRGWDRTYGDTRVYVRDERKPGLAGDVQWTDVYLKRGAANPVNISRCDGTSCGQPSLSADGKLVVFIRASQP